MDRISFDLWGLLLSYASSTRSEDKNTRVGATGFTQNHEICAVSYNGFAPGQIITDELLNDRDKKNLYVRHAEKNMFSRVKKGEIHTLYLTHSPCRYCAVDISVYEIKRVVYGKEYHREQDYKDIFSFYGIIHELIPFSKVKPYLYQLLAET